MDEIQLAHLFVEYAETSKKLSELKALIEAAVLEKCESVKLAGVSATYYKPSFETPDYEGAARSAMPQDFDLTPYTTFTSSVSWKSVCESLFIVPAQGKEKPASVKIK